MRPIHDMVYEAMKKDRLAFIARRLKELRAEESALLNELYQITGSRAV